MNQLLDIWRGLNFDTQVNIWTGFAISTFPILFAATVWLFKRLAKTEERALERVITKVREKELYRGEPMHYSRDLPPAQSGAKMPKVKQPKSADDAEWDAKPVEQMTQDEIDREIRKLLSRQSTREEMELRRPPPPPPPPPPPKSETISDNTLVGRNAGKFLIATSNTAIGVAPKSQLQEHFECMDMGALRKAVEDSGLTAEQLSKALAEFAKAINKDTSHTGAK